MPQGFSANTCKLSTERISFNKMLRPQKGLRCRSRPDLHVMFHGHPKNCQRSSFRCSKESCAWAPWAKGQTPGNGLENKASALAVLARFSAAFPAQKSAIVHLLTKRTTLFSTVLRINPKLALLCRSPRTVSCCFIEARIPRVLVHRTVDRTRRLAVSTELFGFGLTFMYCCFEQ